MRNDVYVIVIPAIYIYMNDRIMLSLVIIIELKTKPEQLFYLEIKFC